ncbi:MAG: hypothetical protein WKF75_07530, partial [Singulisphaera sp.]
MRLEGLRPGRGVVPARGEPGASGLEELVQAEVGGGEAAPESGDPIGHLGEPRCHQPELDGTILEQPGRRLAGGDGVEQGFRALPGAGQTRGDRGLQPPG